MPDSPIPAHQRIAATLLGAQRVAVLTGLMLGRPDDQDLTTVRAGWANEASLEVLLTDPGRFWRYCLPEARKIAARTVTPAHEAIRRLHDAGIVDQVITQSVDHLQALAGVPDVIEVHGNILSATCTRCGERYGLAEVEALITSADDGVPRCTAADCAFPLRPSSTLWGEPLIEPAVRRAWQVATEADCFMVVDSDLRAVPMSLLPSVPLTRGVPLIMLGTVATQYDRYATVLAREPSEPVLVALADLVGSTQ